MDFMQSKMHELILSDITTQYLQKGLVHKFSVQIAAPYLMQKISKALIGGTVPAVLHEKLFPDLFLSQEKQILAISEKLFECSERILKGDYSIWAGEQDMVNLKIGLYLDMHNGIKSIDELKATFQKDIKLLIPVLNQIEQKLNNFISVNRTIIVKDSSFFDDNVNLEKVLKSIQCIELKNQNDARRPHEQ